MSVHTVIRSVCEQDNSQTRERTLTKHGRQGMTFYDHFPPAVNITKIRLYKMYFDSTGVATALLSNSAAAVSETMQEPRWSLSYLSTVER